MRPYLLIISFSLLCFWHSDSVFAQVNATHHHQLYQSFKSGDMDAWFKVMDGLQNQYNKSPNNQLLWVILQAQYGYIGYLIGIKETRQARQMLSEAEKNVEVLLSANPKNADAIALKGSFLAYHISLSPYKAPFLGPRSMGLIDEALQLQPNSIQAQIEKGNAAHYAPSMFGGNPSEAVKHYTKAISLFESNNGGNLPESWLYLNTLAQLAMAYEKAKQTENARSTYRRILFIAPDFKWVKDELYPQFLKRNS